MAKISRNSPRPGTEKAAYAAFSLLAWLSTKLHSAAIRA
jgi:hypothetical protein